MAALVALLGACAVMMLLTPTPVHTDCEVIDRYNYMKDLKCSNMSIDEDSPYDPILQNAKLGMYAYIGSLFIHGVNFVKLPYSKWFKEIDYFEVRRNNKNMSEYVISRFTKLSVINVSDSATPKVYKGLYTTSDSSHLNIIFENLNINKIQNLCHDSTSNYPPWSLSLRHNRITNFTKNTIGTEKCILKLKDLDLKYNNLTSFDADVFVSLTALESIDLSYNQIVTFHDSIVNFPNHALKLVHFYLDNNHISELKGNIFKYFGNLKLLTLDSNSLSYLHINTFNNLNKLETLGLSHNKISNIDPRVFSGLISLKNLNLSGNRIVIFEPQYYDPIFNSLRYISLDENLWDCVELKDLIDYLSNKYVNYTTSIKPNSSVANVSGIICNDNNLTHVINIELNNVTKIKNSLIEHKNTFNFNKENFQLEKKCIDVITQLELNKTKEISQLKINNIIQDSQLRENCNREILQLKLNKNLQIDQMKLNLSNQILQLKENYSEQISKLNIEHHEKNSQLKDEIMQLKANISIHTFQFKAKCNEYILSVNNMTSNEFDDSNTNICSTYCKSRALKHTGQIDQNNQPFTEKITPINQGEQITKITEKYKQEIAQLKLNNSAQISELNKQIQIYNDEIKQLKMNHSISISQVEITLKTKFEKDISQLKENYTNEIQQLNEQIQSYNDQIIQLKLNHSEQVSQLIENNNEEKSQLSTNYDEHIFQLKLNCSDQLLASKENCSELVLSDELNINKQTLCNDEYLVVIIVVVSVILIVMALILTFVGIKLVRAYHSNLQKMVVEGMKSTYNRNRSPIRVEERHYDDVEMNEYLDHSRHVTFGIYEEPPSLHHNLE